MIMYVIRDVLCSLYATILVGAKNLQRI